VALKFSQMGCWVSAHIEINLANRVRLPIWVATASWAAMVMRLRSGGSPLRSPEPLIHELDLDDTELAIERHIRFEQTDKRGKTSNVQLPVPTPMARLQLHLLTPALF
jgi:hypothetical protein